ncbi:hypothetical protein B0919_20835 [Hymenobacter sp. CRA2]|nr:hypothetical protein B0919_20835 [Hymenobacter sp. CRA2]
MLLHLLALGYQLGQRHYLFPDSDRYLTEAANIGRAGEFYAWPLSGPRSVQEYTIRPPGYPLFLLLTGGTLALPLGTLLLQNLLSLLNLGLMAQLLRRFQPSARVWGAVLALIALYPAQLIYANVLMSELLLQTCVVGLLCVGTAFLAHHRRRDALLLSLVASAAMLIKPVFYPFAAVVLAVSMWAAWQRRCWQLALFGTVPLLVALLYQGWNYQRTGYFHFSSIAEINLLRYNVRGVLRKTQGTEAAEHFVAATVRAGEQQPSFAAQQRYITAQCAQVLQQHPMAYAALHLQGMANFFLDPGRFDLVHFLGLPESSEGGLLNRFNAHGYRAIWEYLQTAPIALLLTLALVALGNVVRTLAFALFLFDSKAPAALRVVAGGLVLYVAALTGPLGAARFAVPVAPLLLLGVPFALARLRRFRARRT